LREHGAFITFLDEFRMIFLAPQTSPDVLEFTLFDTLVPRGHPVHSRRFCLPPRYHDQFLSIHVDSDRCLGTLDRDRFLTTDPTQAVFVMKLVSHNRSRVLLIARMQTLIEYVRSTGTGACVPWDIWGRGAAIMEIPIPDGALGGPYPLVQGVHVILVKMSTSPSTDGPHPRPCLCIFDLSRRRFSTLPRWDVDGGIEREVPLEDGRQVLLQGDEWMVEWGFDPLGDGEFMYLVSCFRYWESTSRLTLCKG